MGKPNFFSLLAADDGLDIDEVEVTSAIDVSHLETYSMLLGGTFVGTVSFEVSFDDGVTWVPHPNATGKTVPGVFLSGGIRVNQIRGNCTAYTSGAPKIQVSGTDEDLRD